MFKAVTAVTVGAIAQNGLSRGALRVTSKRNRHEVRSVTTVTGAGCVVYARGGCAMDGHA